LAKCSDVNVLETCAVVITWKWEASTKTAAFWLDEGVAKKWMEDRWRATILRMDIWGLCCMPEDCREELKVDERWG